MTQQDVVLTRVGILLGGALGIMVIIMHFLGDSLGASTALQAFAAFIGVAVIGRAGDWLMGQLEKRAPVATAGKDEAEAATAAVTTATKE